MVKVGDKVLRINGDYFPSNLAVGTITRIAVEEGFTKYWIDDDIGYSEGEFLTYSELIHYLYEMKPNSDKDCLELCCPYLKKVNQEYVCSLPDSIPEDCPRVNPYDNID